MADNKVIFGTESGSIKITGKPKEATFFGFLLLMLREAIEPVALAIGISLLYTRYESVADILQETMQSPISAIFSDSEAHPMIYFSIALVFVAWIFYKSWKLKEDKLSEREKRIRDQELKDALVNINKTLNKIDSKLGGGKNEL